MNDTIATIKTGNLFQTKEQTAPCTLRKPLDIVIKEIHGPYTELDRKLWNVLMYLACEELDQYSLKAQYHSVSEHEIITLFSQYSGVKDLELIWKSLKRLVATTVNIEFEDDTRKIKEATNLINARIIEQKKDRKGSIEFMFPPAIAKLAKDPERFTRIKMHFMLSLRGKYSVALYETLESRVNMRLPYHQWRIDELRLLMRVPTLKLNRWIDLKRFAIDPFIKEMNKNPEKSGFSVSYGTVTGYRNRVTAVRFYLEKHDSREKFENRIVKACEQDNISRGFLFSTCFYESLKKEMPGLDLYALKDDWDQSVVKIANKVGNPEGHFRNFCRKIYRKQQSKYAHPAQTPQFVESK